MNSRLLYLLLRGYQGGRLGTVTAGEAGEVSSPQCQSLTKGVRPEHRQRPGALVARANVDAGTAAAEWPYQEWGGEASETTRLPAIAPANAAKTVALVTFANTQKMPGLFHQSFWR